MKLYFISTCLRVCRDSRGHNNLVTIVYCFLCLLLYNRLLFYQLRKRYYNYIKSYIIIVIIYLILLSLLLITYLSTSTVNRDLQ